MIDEQVKHGDSHQITYLFKLCTYLHNMQLIVKYADRPAGSPPQGAVCALLAVFEVMLLVVEIKHERHHPGHQ